MKCPPGTFLRHLLCWMSSVFTLGLVGAAAQPTPDDDRAPPTNPALAQIEDEPGLPRVLLIGDSISIGYTLPTRELLRGVANVHRIPENGGPTTRGLQSIEPWLATGNPNKAWDVIHFNWGLHDLKHVKDGELDFAGPQVNSPEQYAENLRQLVERLRQTGAKLVFATTTPVPEGADGREAGEEVKFNEAARAVMRENDVAIDDLHEVLIPRLAEVQRTRNVHFKPAGYAILAEQVATSIREALALAQPALAAVEDVPGLPRVLLIGDSISIGYTLPVRERLAGVANVHRIPMNGGPTDRGLEHIERWLDTDGPGKPWDVIHFNWGIHDLKREKEGREFTGPHVNPPAQYLENLQRLVARLKQTGAKLIFATTTPIPPGAFRCVAGDEVIFNDVALKLMRQNGVAIDDLHTWIAPFAAGLQRSANVHFTPEGSDKLAEKVATEVRRVLKEN